MVVHIFGRDKAVLTFYPRKYYVQEGYVRVSRHCNITVYSPTIQYNSRRLTKYSIYEQLLLVHTLLPHNTLQNVNSIRKSFCTPSLLTYLVLGSSPSQPQTFNNSYPAQTVENSGRSSDPNDGHYEQNFFSEILPILFLLAHTYVTIGSRLFKRKQL